MLLLFCLQSLAIRAMVSISGPTLSLVAVAPSLRPLLSLAVKLTISRIAVAMSTAILPGACGVSGRWCRLGVLTASRVLRRTRWSLSIFFGKVDPDKTAVEPYHC